MFRYLERSWQWRIIPQPAGPHCRRKPQSDRRVVVLLAADRGLGLIRRAERDLLYLVMDKRVS